MGKTEIVQDSNVAVQPQRAHAVSVGAPAVQTTIVPASSGCECGTPAYATCAAKTVRKIILRFMLCGDVYQEYIFMLFSYVPAMVSCFVEGCDEL